MSLFTAATLAAGRLLPGAEEIPFDDKGYTTIDPIFPPLKELISGHAGVDHRVHAPGLEGRPDHRKKASRDRTERIQKQLDDAAAAKTAADAEAVRIREAQGDIDAERSRLSPRPTPRPQHCSPTAGPVSPPRSPNSRPRRGRHRIGGRTGHRRAARRDRQALVGRGRRDRVVDTLDDAAQQELIEGFIAQVGASTGASA